jgi:hypothetical protein
LQRIVQDALPGAQILRVTRFGTDTEASDETSKASGYGAPLRLEVLDAGVTKTLVLHTASENEFGHDRRADRAAEMVLAADTFGSIPNHVEVLGVGAYRDSGDFVSLRGTGEFYLLTTHAEGRPYAEDLRRISRSGLLTELDLARGRTLVHYLSALHANKPEPSRAAYVRSIRDSIGSGEGVFGIADGYPEGVPAASGPRLQHIEERCIAWRWYLKRRSARLARIHGDFHPFNVLFGDQTKLALLDTSRGSLGDPADDVTCMSINFAFFALGHPGAWRGALRSLWRDFWARYVSLSHDEDIFEVVAPFFAWRGLVLANPKWYPELAPADRERILGFVEQVLDSARFSPSMAEEFFDS